MRHALPEADNPMRLNEPWGLGRGRAAAEISFVVICVLIAEWAIIPLFGRNKRIGLIPIAAVLIFTFLSHRRRGEGAREIGFTGKHFWEALRSLLQWMIPAAAFLLAAGATLGSLHYRGPKRWDAILLAQFGLFLWGLMQQYALQSIVNRRAQEICGKGWRSTLAAALIFGFLHLPNVWLTAATLAAGVLWAAVYQRTPNLFALAVSHSLMTTVLACSISPAVLHGMRVGYNYF
jgi:membrane protease YdiL (CAAX protease family)